MKKPNFKQANFKFDGLYCKAIEEPNGEKTICMDGRWCQWSGWSEEVKAAAQKALDKA